MIDLSIDCETLGVAYDAPLVAIGARVFDMKTGKLGKSFYAEVAIASATKVGRVDPDTLGWWISQSPRAKKIFSTPDTKKPNVATALMNFNDFIRDEIGLMKARVWANGPAQDVIWLERHYTEGGYGMTIPWAFRLVRDMRTIVDLATELATFNKGAIEEVGTEHNAVDDATYQANVISAAYAALRDTVEPL